MKLVGDGSYVIGIDGGGTKTESVLVDMDGHVLNVGVGGSVNMMFAGHEVAEQSVGDSIHGLLANMPDPLNIVAAGICLMGAWRIAQRILQTRGFDGPYFLYHESAVGFRSCGLIGESGVAIVAGTGSGVRYFNGQRDLMNIGGWGIGVGDEGSAFDIGLHAIKAAGRAMDGRGEKTLLVDLLKFEEDITCFGHALNKYCFPSLKQRDIASLARLVSQAAEQGDAVAIDILAQAGRSLGGDAAYVASKFHSASDTFNIACAGGVFKAGHFVTVSLAERVHSEFPNARIHMPKISPGEAAALLAMERYAAGPEPDPPPGVRKTAWIYT